MTLRILHTSDLHLPRDVEARPARLVALLDALRGGLGPYDVWVDCGDLLPDPPASLNPQQVWTTRLLPEAKRRAAQWQRAWLAEVAPVLLDCLGGRPAVLCDGNHHWHSSALDISDRASNVLAARLGAVVEACVLRWTGLPHTPPLGGRFYREVHPPSWPDVLAMVPAADVLVSHAPPSGPLSMHLEWGIPGIDRLLHPLVLCGHIHQRGGGERTERGQRVVNGATRIRILEVDL